MFNHDGDVAKYVNQSCKYSAAWNKREDGVRNCIVRWNNGDTRRHMELDVKLGVLCHTRDGTYVRYWCPKERAKEIREIQKEGNGIGLLIGIKGTSQVLFNYPNRYSLSGRFKMDSATFIDHCLVGDASENGVWKEGLNYLFLRRWD